MTTVKLCYTLALKGSDSEIEEERKGREGKKGWMTRPRRG